MAYQFFRLGVLEQKKKLDRTRLSFRSRRAYQVQLAQIRDETIHHLVRVIVAQLLEMSFYAALEVFECFNRFAFARQLCDHFAKPSHISDDNLGLDSLIEVLVSLERFFPSEVSFAGVGNLSSDAYLCTLRFGIFLGQPAVLDLQHLVELGVFVSEQFNVLINKQERRRLGELDLLDSFVDLLDICRERGFGEVVCGHCGEIVRPRERVE